MNQFKEVEFNKRLSKMEHQHKQTLKLLSLFSEKFCWYWVTEHKKQFAVISRQGVDVRTKEITADLVVIDTSIACGVDTRMEKKIFIANPVLAETGDNPKIGRYEPILDPEEILQFLEDSKEVADASTAVVTA